MNTIGSQRLQKLQPPITQFPAVTVILPFQPKMIPGTILSKTLRAARNEVEKRLFENYSAEIAALVMEKLLAIYNKINFNTHKKSIAIYISPVFEKILYLNLEVEETISVNDSFDIRDILRYTKVSQQYTVLVLTQNGSKIYAFHDDQMRQVFSSTPLLAEKYTSNIVRKAGVYNKDITFLQYTDNVLDNILRVYPFPFFIAGEAFYVNQFREISRHNNSVLEYVLIDERAQDPSGIIGLLNPYVKNVKLLQQNKILSDLKYVERRGGLVTGLRNVLQEVISGKGTLLVVEKDFTFPDLPEINMDGFLKPGIYSSFSYINDYIGYIIEKVLENGGNVETVDGDLLKEFKHIVLFK